MTMYSVKMELTLKISQAKTSEKFFIVLGVLLALFSHIFFVEGARSGCGIPLGMEDGRIQNWQIDAYSYDTGYYAKNGRLNGKGAWCADSEKPWTEYFQINLAQVRHVSGIGIQGLKNTGIFAGEYWVKSFAIEYSFNYKKWYWYKESLSSFSSVKVFLGSTDASTEKRVHFRDTFVTKYLRIYPIDFYEDMCLRVEVYGCPNGKDCTKDFTAPSGLLSSPDFPLNYPVGIDCTWIIKLSDKSKNIAAFFKYMDVNNGASVLTCAGDSVTARDGLQDISTSLGQFCNGETTPVIETSGETMSLYFHSDAKSIARKGFQIAYYSFTRGVDDIYKSVACSGSSIRLDCSSRSSKSIKILYAFYGTMPFSSHCGSKGDNSSCQASGVMQKMKTLCEHLKVCTTDFSGPHLGLNCQAGSVPRLVVYYQCTGAFIRTLPPSTPSTTTPSTTIHSTTLPTDFTTTSSTLPPQTKPSVPLETSSLKTKRHIPTTPAPTNSTTKPNGEKLARASEKDNTGLLIGIVVVVILVVIVLVLVLVCIMYRRRKNPKNKIPRTVTYTAGGGTTELDGLSPSGRDMRSGSRSNPYETVNVLYVSADDACYKDRNVEHIYDSPELHEPLPQMTENPLYHGGLDAGQDTAAYESIDPQNPSDSKVPSSLDPAIYDSPIPLGKQKSNTAKSISNPNYGKTIEIPEK